MAQTDLHSDIQSGSVPFSLCITHCMDCFPACGGYSLTCPTSLFQSSLHEAVPQSIYFGTFVRDLKGTPHFLWHASSTRQT